MTVSQETHYKSPEKKAIKKTHSRRVGECVDVRTDSGIRTRNSGATACMIPFHHASFRLAFIIAMTNAFVKAFLGYTTAFIQ